MAETEHVFVVTPIAGEFVAGIRHGGAGTTVRLTPVQARYELLLGSIVPDGTPVPPGVPVGPVAGIDRITAIRGGGAWDFAVGELALFLAQGILGDTVRVALDAFEGKWAGDASPVDDTLGKIAGRVALIAEAVRSMRSVIDERARVLTMDRAPRPSDLETDVPRYVRDTTTGRVSLWVSDGRSVRDLLDISNA